MNNKHDYNLKDLETITNKLHVLILQMWDRRTNISKIVEPEEIEALIKAYGKLLTILNRTRRV